MLHYVWYGTFKPLSQLPGEQHIGQFTLLIAFPVVIIFIHIDVIEINFTCK